MNAADALKRALKATGRACRWFIGCAGDVITSAENRINWTDAKTVGVKIVPRLFAVGGAAKAAGVSKAAVAVGIIQESLAQEDVFLAAMALAGAVLWSIHETIQRHKAAPTPTNPPVTS